MIQHLKQPNTSEHNILNDRFTAQHVVPCAKCPRCDEVFFNPASRTSFKLPNVSGESFIWRHEFRSLMRRSLQSLISDSLVAVNRVFISGWRANLVTDGAVWAVLEVFLLFLWVEARVHMDTG